MSIKHTFLIFLGLILLIPSVFWVIADDPIKNPCDPVIMEEALKRSVFENKNSFFTKQQIEGSNIDSIANVPLDLQSYIQSQMKLLNVSNEASQDARLDAYHSIQAKLFEDVLKQDLDQYSGIKNEAVEKSNPPKRNFSWKETLNQYPIIALYKKKFNEQKDLPGIIPVVPTLVLGFQATLNYAIFSCNYTADIQKIYGESSKSSQDVVIKRNSNASERAAALLRAKRIMELALSAYDALALAYPQHIAYEQLIVELKKLRERFGTFEEISSSCVYANHFNASCQKK